MDKGRFVDRIVVGTDGSSDATTAVETAGRLAEQLGAEVVLVHAVMLLEHLEGRPATPAVAVRDEVEALLTSVWNQPLTAASVPHRCVLEDGPPLLALPRVAERESAAFIVVASHGEGQSYSQQLGATSHGLVAHAPLPVLVVPCRT